MKLISTCLVFFSYDRINNNKSFISGIQSSGQKKSNNKNFITIRYISWINNLIQENVPYVRLIKLSHQNYIKWNQENSFIFSIIQAS